MKTVQATALRRDLFGTLKRMSYVKEPILVERRGKVIAGIVPSESITGPKAALPTGRPLIDPKALADFCAKRRIKTLYLFGSILTDAFDADSDVDVMFVPDGPSPSYFEQMAIADELEAMFGRPVDLVSRSAVESSPNRFRRQAILDSARIIHGR